MKRVWLWLVLLLSLGINVGLLASFGLARDHGRQDRFDRMRHEGPPPLNRMAEHLGLDGEVRDEFVSIQRRLFDTIRQKREELDEVRHELRREVVSREPDRVRIERLLQESVQISGEIERALVDTVIECRQILNPDQQQRYFEILSRLPSSSRRLDSRRPRPDERPGR